MNHLLSSAALMAASFACVASSRAEYVKDRLDVDTTPASYGTITAGGGTGTATTNSGDVSTLSSGTRTATTNWGVQASVSWTRTYTQVFRWVGYGPPSSTINASLTDSISGSYSKPTDMGGYVGAGSQAAATGSSVSSYSPGGQTSYNLSSTYPRTIDTNSASSVDYSFSVSSNTAVTAYYGVGTISATSSASTTVGDPTGP